MFKAFIIIIGANKKKSQKKCLWYYDLARVSLSILMDKSSTLHCLQLDIQILEKWNTMLCCWTHPLTAVRAEDGSCSVHHLCRVCNSVTVSAGALGDFKMFSSVKTVCVCVFHRLQYIHFMFKWNQSPAEPNNEQHSVTIRICSCYNSYLLMHASCKHKN